MRHLINIILIMLPPTRWFGIKRRLLRLAGIDVGSTTKVCGRTIFAGSGRLALGENTWIGIRSGFYTSSLAAIRIGNHCDIGPEVAFVAGSHEIGRSDRRAGKGRAGDIVVGDGCWVGARATILGGVTIGNGAVIAAGALVRNDVPPNSLVAGVPATVKRTLSDA